ncbi:MAG: hypothetical protein HY913_04655 [Desulfomonile tiedjei]|nr:hypothetical protein [Desulfomonile tiedjei]
MLVKDKGSFIKGLLLAITFLIVLVIMFLPYFGHGENALRAADRLFNSISKGSTNYFPDMLKKNKAYEGVKFDVSVKFKDQQSTQRASKLLTSAGAKATEEAGQLKITGDLGAVMGASLKDSEAMFNNRDAELQTKYGFPGREVLYSWWATFKEMDKDLKRQAKFKEAAFLGDVVKKGVEVGYNFFTIEPESASSKMGILSFSLIFYVIYTLWWGIAVLFLFEGIGLQMKAGAKKEV